MTMFKAKFGRFTLDRKLFLSYLIIVLITVSTSFFLFTASSSRYLKYRLEESMASTLNYLQDAINTHPDYRPTGNYFKADILKLVQTELVAWTDEGIISSTAASLTYEIIRHVEDLELMSEYYYFVMGQAENDLGQWNIVLFVEKSAFHAITEINLTILFAASIISMAIAILFSRYAQKNITTPIIELTQKVMAFRKQLVEPQHTIFTGDEIQELDENIVVMADDILGNDRQRKVFFENTSHELKTPLMSIRGYAEGLKDGIFGVDEAADVILAESESLRMMVEDILYLSKLEDASLDRYQFDLLESNDFLVGFYHKMKPMIQEKGLHFTLNLDESVKVCLDDDKMIRALSNIITNAIRYAERKIGITTYLKNDYLNIRICNDGPKVPEENLPQLFDRFFKGEKGQSGLGLAIVSAIITSHQGTTTAYNLEAGFCINIEIPYNAIKGK